MSSTQSSDFAESPRPLLPYTRAGFFLLAVCSGYLALIVLKRMQQQRQQQQQNDENNTKKKSENAFYEQWFLFLSRIGLLNFTSLTVVDNFRIMLLTFEYLTWPEDCNVWMAHPNGQLANELWITNCDRQTKYGNLAVILYWFCSYAHEVLSAICIYNVIYLLYIGIKKNRNDGNSNTKLGTEDTTSSSSSSSRGNAKAWFIISTLLVLGIGTLSIHGFIIGPATGTLKLKASASYLFLKPSIRNPYGGGILNVILWQTLMVMFGFVLLILEGRKHLGTNVLLTGTNMICFVLHAIARPSNDRISSNFAEQLAFATAIYYDAKYNVTATTTTASLEGKKEKGT